MRADRPSLTATLVAGVRAIYAAFPEGLRVAPDPHAAALVPEVLAVQARAAAALPWAAPLVHRALGVGTVGLSWHVALRTLAIDDAARAAVQHEATPARQVVLLGAGLDNRAGRLPELSAARFFEVDHPDMQRYKRARLAAAGLDGDGRVLVPVNFEVDRLDERLGQAGFSRDVATFWIWEGVTPYLTRAAVEDTLRAVAGLSAAGSRIAITYMRPAKVDRVAGFLGGLVGEHLRSRYPREEMASLLSGVGFQVMADEADADLADRYWKDPPPSHPRSIHLFPEWERLVVAERVSV